MSIADVDFTPPRARSRSHDISMFCIEKCKQPEILVSSKATTLSNYWRDFLSALSESWKELKTSNAFLTFIVC